MRIRNQNMRGVTIGNPDDQSRPLKVDDNGILDAPEGFANFLLSTPGWEPVDGASLGSIATLVGRPPEMTEEEHAQLLAREAAEREAAAAAANAPPPPPLPPALTTQPPPPPADDSGETGPDLDAMSKAELLACAEQYRAQGYEIDLGAATTKAEIKAVLHAALYGSDEG